MASQVSASSTILQIKNVYKSFGDTEVIRGLSFDVSEGEFLTILGSSGCGKTTLLRMICGLEDVDRGQIILAGEDVTKSEPNHRAVNTVFQSYALFPHMNVYDNVAYPLRIAHTPKDEIRQRVRDALALVQMEGYEKRYPSEMSGGQKQRIAIARAVIGKPKILLLDEPLGALDLNLRRAMQGELKNLQETLGITFIYITHDQEEALNMSDRIAVMQGGSFVQIGTPSEIYDTPESVYVARFIGEANILPCTYIADCADGCRVKFSEAELVVRKNKTAHRSGDLTNAAVRGEKIAVRSHDAGAAGIPAVVKSLNFAGGVMRVTAESCGTQITAMRYGLDTSIEVGQQVMLEIPSLAGVLVNE